VCVWIISLVLWTTFCVSVSSLSCEWVMSHKWVMSGVNGSFLRECMNSLVAVVLRITSCWSVRSPSWEWVMSGVSESILRECMNSLVNPANHILCKCAQSLMRMSHVSWVSHVWCEWVVSVWFYEFSRWPCEPHSVYVLKSLMWMSHVS